MHNVEKHSRGVEPKPRNGRLVTVRVLPSTNEMLLTQSTLWTAQEQVDLWMLSSVGNMSVARDMLPRHEGSD
jgi:hypothetical protein